MVTTVNDQTVDLIFCEPQLTTNDDSLCIAEHVPNSLEGCQASVVPGVGEIQVLEDKLCYSRVVYQGDGAALYAVILRGGFLSCPCYHDLLTYLQGCLNNMITNENERCRSRDSVGHPAHLDPFHHNRVEQLVRVGDGAG